MPGNSYHIGQAVEVTGLFKVGTTPTNPSTITLKVKTPAGLVEERVFPHPSITNPTTGSFVGLVVPDASGVWYYRWEGTGSCQAADEACFVAIDSVFYPP